MNGFRLLESRIQGEVIAPAINEWQLPQGGTFARFHRLEAGYLVRFPDLADFEIRASGPEVTCLPAPGVNEETCKHLFLNQVLPLVMSRSGYLVFHASAVEIDGSATAFVASSGRGKSTLAASFATGGHRFMSDDGLVVEAGRDGFHALPSHPSIRLWDDSCQALIEPGAATAPSIQYTSKARFLAGSALPFCAQARPMRCAYFLGDGSAQEVEIGRMSESEALMEWMRNSFVLDPAERAILASHFDRLSALANRLACYRLDYPRRYEDLPATRSAIIEHQRRDVPAP